ncbi:hypothetical protein LINPERHAP2_LOCUS14928 [Linum perenne]
MESSDSPGFQLLTMSEESTFDDERGIHGGPVSVKADRRSGRGRKRSVVSTQGQGAFDLLKNQNRLEDNSKITNEIDESKMVLICGREATMRRELRRPGSVRVVRGSSDLELLNSQPTMAESSATVKLDGGGATAEDWAGIGVGVELGLMLERWSTTGSRDLKSALDLRPRRLLEKLIKLLTAAAVAVAQSLHHGKSQIFLGADEGSDLRLRKTVGRSRRIVAATTTKLHSCGFSDKT